MAALRELVFTITADTFDAWSDALLAGGALSVQAEDADADSADEQALYGEPGAEPERAGWRHTRVSALIDDRVDASALLTRAATAIDRARPGSHAVREVPDQDWVGRSQSQFEPIRIGARLVITPTWHLDRVAHDTSDGNGEQPITIVLDPGLAFGTGSHATTRLCLRWLCDEAIAGQTVIDYGCGSGILAIAAARLGASQVLGVDIDPQAVAATIANARSNGVDIEARCSIDATPEPADVVIANILANPLKLLAPMLGALVKPGGRLVLCGLLDRQVDEVSAAYPAFALSAHGSTEGWTCLAGPKR